MPHAQMGPDPFRYRARRHQLPYRSRREAGGADAGDVFRADSTPEETKHGGLEAAAKIEKECPQDAEKLQIARHLPTGTSEYSARDNDRKPAAQNLEGQVSANREEVPVGKKSDWWYLRQKGNPHWARASEQLYSVRE